MDLIIAADRRWAIGNKGGLLCHLSGDMKYFKEKTTGNVIVMGRATLESFPKPKGLPNRVNIVLSRNPEYQAEDVTVCHSDEELRQELRKYPDRKIFIIGGESIYRKYYKECENLFVTKIDAEFEADRWFVDIDQDPEFRIAWESEPQEEHGIRYRFVRYEKVR